MDIGNKSETEWVVLDVEEDTRNNIQISKWMHDDNPHRYHIDFLYTCIVDGTVKVDCALDGEPWGVVSLMIIDISQEASHEQLDRFIEHVRTCIMKRYDTQSFVLVTEIDQWYPIFRKAFLGFGYRPHCSVMETSSLGSVQTSNSKRITFPVSTVYKEPDVFKYGVGLRCHVYIVKGMRDGKQVYYDVPVWVSETPTELVVMFAKPINDRMPDSGGGDVYFHIADAQFGTSLMFEDGEDTTYYEWPRWNKLYAMSALGYELGNYGSSRIYVSSDTIVYTQFSLFKWEDDKVPEDVIGEYRADQWHYESQHRQLLGMARYVAFRLNHAARIIQRQWKQAVMNPKMMVCRNRLSRELKQLCGRSE